MQTVEIIRKSITELDTGIIVNAANRYLQAGGGVCGYIFKAAGYEKLQEACDKIGGCATGDAIITPGFRLCSYIVHAVGPQYVDGKHGEAELLYSCYRKALDLARENDCHSIGFPLISSGIYGYPICGAWEQAAKAVADWTKENKDYDIRIVFAVIDNDVLDKGKEIFGVYGVGLLLVRKEDWKTCTMPKQNDCFEVPVSIPENKLDVLRHGHRPTEMEDKWFRYMEGDVLYAHRSWTGFCIYIADFGEKGKIKVTVNRDPEQYTCTDINEDREKFCDLLCRWTDTPYDHYSQWLHEISQALTKASNGR